jgi:hypothetical protein
MGFISDRRHGHFSFSRKIFMIKDQAPSHHLCSPVITGDDFEKFPNAVLYRTRDDSKTSCAH